jgi:Zn-dependent protease/predicted transcriptional regulator
MRRGWLIAKVRGVEVRADASLVLLAVLITYNLWFFYANPATLSLFTFRIHSTSPPLGTVAALGLALVTTALFVGSILAHEVAHAVAFRARGISVRGITLVLFGGYTVGSREADTPTDELVIAGVGPATTCVLGLAFLALHVFAKSAGLHALRAMFGYLAALNLFMGVFNVLPGLPLDGGRVLMSIIWRVTGNRSRATRLAARSGQVVAVAISGIGLLELARTGSLGGLWLLFIGWMLYSGSTAAGQQSARSRMLESTTARDVMSPPPPTVPAGISVATAMERYLSGREGEAFPVTDDGRVVGFISLRLARDAPLGAPVREAMAGTEAVAVADASDRMSEVAEKIQDRNAQVALVVDDGRLVGVIEQEDLARFFRSGRRNGRRSQGRGRRASAPPRPDQSKGGGP